MFQPARGGSLPFAKGALLLAAVLSIGCATVPPAFDTVAISSTAEHNDDGELEGDLTADSPVKGALVGAGSGVALGAVGGFGVGLAVSLGCGPFAIFCAPVAIIVGTFAGGAGGLLVGGAAGGFTGLSWSNTDAVNAVLLPLRTTTIVEEGLQAGLTEGVPAAQQAPPEQAEALVTAKFDEIDLRQHWGQKLSLRFWATMTQEWDRETDDPKSYTCDYEWTTEKEDVEVWLEEDGRAFGENFETAAATFARWMARDLDAFTTRIPQDETDDEPKTCFQGD